MKDRVAGFQASKRSRHWTGLAWEPLERRALFTVNLDLGGGMVQFVEATSGAQNQVFVNVDDAGATLTLSDTSDTLTLSPALQTAGWTLSQGNHSASGPENGLTGVFIDTRDGTDMVTIDSSNLPIEVKPSGSSAETVQLGNQGTAQLVTGSVMFDATNAASAELDIDDRADTNHIDPTFTSTDVLEVTPATISFLPPPASSNSPNPIIVSLETGSGGAAPVVAQDASGTTGVRYEFDSYGPDTIAVQTLDANSEVTVSTEFTGTDRVLLGSFHSLAGILGTVFIGGGVGAPATVVMDDSGDVQPQQAFDITPFSGEIHVDAISSQLSFDPQNVASFTLETGTGSTTIDADFQGIFPTNFTASLEAGQGLGDQIAVTGLPAGATLNIDGADGGSEQVTLTAAAILGNVNFNGAPNGANDLTVDASGVMSDNIVSVSDAAVDGFNDAHISFSNVVALSVTGGTGFDDFNVRPSATTQISVDGGPFTGAAPMDRLVINSSQTPQLNLTIDSNGDHGNYQFSGLQPVDFSRFGLIVPTFGDVSGTLYNQQNGSPAQDVAVTVDTNSNGAADPGEPTTTTGADGSFAFTGLPTGTFPLLVQSASLAVLSPASVTVSAGVINAPLTIPVAPVPAATGPDLVATVVASVTGKGTRNKPKLQIKITNIGAAMATAATVQILAVASLDSALSNDDVKLLTFSTSLRLKARATKTFNLTGSTPATLSAGQYYVLASVDAANAVPETNEANNVAASARAVSLAPPTVDLTGKFGNVPRSASKSKILSVPFTLQNTGTVPAGGSTVFDFYASTDRTLDDSDVALGTNFPVGVHLSPGKSQNLKFKLSIDPALPAGGYYLVAKINPTQSIAESSYANNVIFSAAPIAIG